MGACARLLTRGVCLVQDRLVAKNRLVGDIQSVENQARDGDAELVNKKLAHTEKQLAFDEVVQMRDEAACSILFLTELENPLDVALLH